jgi:hypothetical protein
MSVYFAQSSFDFTNVLRRKFDPPYTQTLTFPLPPLSLTHTHTNGFKSKLNEGTKKDH